MDCLQQEMVVSSMLMGAVIASLTGGIMIEFSTPSLDGLAVT